LPLTLGADESLHVVFRKAATANSVVIKQTVPSTPAKLDGAWSVAFQQGRGAPASASLPTLLPLNENADLSIRHFSGIATYSKEFTAPRGWRAGQPLWLDLGEVGEMAEVTINGKSAGAVWHAPYRLDIGAVTKAGKNRIEVRVANLWINRLIGDAALPEDKRLTWAAGPTYGKDAKLRPSGLIGPVVLLTEGK
jgi:hypothetical protein